MATSLSNGASRNPVNIWSTETSVQYRKWNDKCPHRVIAEKSPIIQMQRGTGWVVNKRPTYVLKDFPEDYIPIDKKTTTHHHYPRPLVTAKNGDISTYQESGWTKHNHHVGPTTQRSKSFYFQKPVSGSLQIGTPASYRARTEPSGWTHREYEDTILHGPEYNHKPLLQSQSETKNKFVPQNYLHDKSFNKYTLDGNNRRMNTEHLLHSKSSLNYNHLPAKKALEKSRNDPTEKSFLNNPSRWATMAGTSYQVPNIRTKNKSNLANDDYSGFVENSNSIRFFPSVEERNFSKSSGSHSNPKYDQSSHVTRKSNRSVTFGTSSKTTQHGPIYDAPEPLPMRRFQTSLTSFNHPVLGERRPIVKAY